MSFKRLATVCAGVGIALGLSVTAHGFELQLGKTLRTPPLRAEYPARHITCDIANVSDDSLLVRVQFVNFDGTLSNDSDAYSLGPDESFSIGALPRLSIFQGVKYGHCRFTVIGNKNAVRASGNVLDGKGMVSSVPAK